MNWSIIARDRTTGALGIAAASRFFTLGALIPWVKGGVGDVAAYTGNDCIDWCGHMGDTDISTAGNMLVGGDVLRACVDAFNTQTALPFSDRLLASLSDGDGVGDDKRSRQSAVLKIHSTEIYEDWDIRVDDYPDVPNELARIVAIGQVAFGTFKQLMPTGANPGGINDRGHRPRAGDGRETRA